MKQGKKANSDTSTIYRMVWEVFLIREYLKSRLERSEGANYVDIGRNSSSMVRIASARALRVWLVWEKRKAVIVAKKKEEGGEVDNKTGQWVTGRLGCLGQSCESIQLFSCSVVSESLRPHGLQHAKLPCPSPTPGACSNSCPLSQWCHSAISSLSSPSPSAFNLSQHQSFPMSQLFASVAKLLEFQL